MQKKKEKKKSTHESAMAIYYQHDMIPPSGHDHYNIGLIMFWTTTIDLFEAATFILEKHVLEQGLISLPLVASLR